MFLMLENNMLNLVDPMDRSVLHSQPIASIRVWGVGRDNGRLVIIAAVLQFLNFINCTRNIVSCSIVRNCSSGLKMASNF